MKPSKTHGELSSLTVAARQMLASADWASRPSPVREATKRDRAPRARSSTKPIEAIEVGDLVWAWDPMLGKSVRRPVVQLFRHQSKPTVAVTVAGGFGTLQRIEATTEHPFWVENTGWVAACLLREGDQLKGIDGSDSLRVVSAQLTDTTKDVFNFEVLEIHNYFVGTDGVLVHNDSSESKATAPQEGRRVDAPTPKPRAAARGAGPLEPASWKVAGEAKASQAKGAPAKAGIDNVTGPDLGLMKRAVAIARSAREDMHTARSLGVKMHGQIENGQWKNPPGNFVQSAASAAKFIGFVVLKDAKTVQPLLDHIGHFETYEKTHREALYKGDTAAIAGLHGHIEQVSDATNALDRTIRSQYFQRLVNRHAGTVPTRADAAPYPKADSVPTTTELVDAHFGRTRAPLFRNILTPRFTLPNSVALQIDHVFSAPAFTKKFWSSRETIDCAVKTVMGLASGKDFLNAVNIPKSVAWKPLLMTNDYTWQASSGTSWGQLEGESRWTSEVYVAPPRETTTQQAFRMAGVRQRAEARAAQSALEARLARDVESIFPGRQPVQSRDKGRALALAVLERLEARSRVSESRLRIEIEPSSHTKELSTMHEIENLAEQDAHAAMRMRQQDWLPNRITRTP